MPAAAPEHVTTHDPGSDQQEDEQIAAQARYTPGDETTREVPASSIPIGEYAVLGDMKTAALVSRAGSIDWLCLPRFDSPACFAALLGTADNGHWLVGPAGEATSTRAYVPGTFILETTHTTGSGSVKVTDLMPTSDDRADVVRMVEGLTGSVPMRHEWVVRFSYGKITPWVSRHKGPDGGRRSHYIRAVAGPDMLVLRGDRLPKARGGTHVDEFDVRAGERLVFAMTWAPSFLELVPNLVPDDVVEQTREQWLSTKPDPGYHGPYQDAVERSLLTLRLLTDHETGGIVAAPTTSLPEHLGGVRNWDYRYCWLRDASLTLASLMDSGYLHETELWRRWLIRAIAGDPQDMQIMYAVDGAREIPEQVLRHLPGYADSAPVRIGNGAVDQRQSDVLGEVMMALSDGRDRGLTETDQSWRIQRALVEMLAEHWDEPDNGVWEIRGPLRHFTYSRVMVWAAFDRAVRAVEYHQLPGPVDKWRELRDRIHDEVMSKGFNTERNTFVQHYDTDEVDASLLRIGMSGFLHPDDPKVLGTIAAVEQDLMQDGLLLRYRTASGIDGLPGREHPFLACSFWLVRAHAAAGNTERARELMDHYVTLGNDVGLFSEEYDPARGLLIGNYPQAFSHLALIQAAHSVAGDPSVGP